MDPWHWDSVAYTGVILLNDFNDFVGGELECMRMEKRRALKELARDSNLIILVLCRLYQLLFIILQVANKVVKGVHTDVINYEKPGRMILAQGSEVLHHVTPVLSKSRRFRNQHDFDTFRVHSIHSIAGFP